MVKIAGVLALALTVAAGAYWVVQSRDSASDAPTRYEIRGRDVGYFENRNGYYVAPTEPGRYPGVVMVHEWWGLNDQIRGQAERLATEGYRVLAVDLFGTVAATTSEAQKQVKELDQAKAIENLKAAVAFLENEGARRTGVVGWCFGGGQAMQLSLAESDLDATVIYYGNVVTDPSELKKIDWPVLGIFGEEDRSIASTTVRQFEEALKSAGVEGSIHLYPGVGHAFANPSNPNHAPAETADAWEKTTAFLREHLK